MNLPKIVPPLSQISIYETKGFLLLCGYSVSSCTYNMLEITRPTLSTSGELNFKPHPQSYTVTQMEARLKQMKSVYKDLELIQSDVECVYGIVKLLDSHYLIVVTKKRLVGSIVGHSIYTIEAVSYIPVTYKLRVTAEEPRYKSLLTSFDLTKHIHFSYTYDLSRSWQQQVSQKEDISKSEVNRVDTQHMFTWNNFALQPFLQFNKNDQTLDAWVMPVVYGYFRQKNLRFNDDLTLGFALIARRSRHFAGTRYLRRGSDCVGHVANEVETEQLFIRSTSNPGDCPRVSSVIQCRGSIPLFWSHTNLYNPKPDVQLEDSGMGSEQSAKIHFQKLFSRYGSGVHVVNLVKQTEPKPLEQIVGNAFRETVEVLNKQFVKELDMPNPITFIAYDFLNMAKKQHALEAAGGEVPSNSPNVFKDLNTMCEEMFPKIGFYVDPPICDPKVMSYPLTDTNTGSDSSSGATMDRQAFILKKELQSLSKVITDPEAEDDILHLSEETGVGRGTRTGLKQFGVMRTNCMDCLDRTNVAQFCFARVAIPRQVLALGIALSSQGIAAVISACMEVWAEHGDTIATQYGGSGAMHKVDQQEDDEGENHFVLTGGAKNALVACQRFYSNISTDYERQQSMDLLLGIFEPRKDEAHIWEHKHRARHLRVGKLGRRTSDLIAGPVPLPTQTVTAQDTSPVTDKEVANYISDLRAAQPSVALSTSTLSTRPGFRIEGLAGQFFHTASLIRISLTVFSDLVEETDIESVAMNKIPVYPFPPSSLLAVGGDILRFTGSESGDPPETKQLTPREETYNEYIEGQLLFPSRVDLTDRNLSSQQRDTQLAATIQKLAGIDNILSVLGEGVDSPPAKKAQMSYPDERGSQSALDDSVEHLSLASRTISREQHATVTGDMKKTDYFSFSDIYAKQDNMEDRATLESKSSDVAGDVAGDVFRSSSSDQAQDKSTVTPSSVSQSQKGMTEQLPSPQQQQQPPVKPSPPAKKGGFFGMFSKSKAEDAPPPAPVVATPPTTTTSPLSEPSSSGSSFSSSSHPPPSPSSSGTSAHSSTAPLPAVMKTPSSTVHTASSSDMQGNLNRIVQETVQKELRKMNLATPGMLPGQNNKNSSDETVKELNIKIALLQKTVESLLDLRIGEDCNV